MLRSRDSWLDVVLNWFFLLLLLIPVATVAMTGLVALTFKLLGAL